MWKYVFRSDGVGEAQEDISELRGEGRKYRVLLERSFQA